CLRPTLLYCSTELPPHPPFLTYTPLCRSPHDRRAVALGPGNPVGEQLDPQRDQRAGQRRCNRHREREQQALRKSTRLNSSHFSISYAVFCLKKKKDHNSKMLNDSNLTMDV